MKRYTYLCLLGFLSTSMASKTKDESYSDSLKDCVEFANKFDNTCDSLTRPVMYHQVPTKKITAKNVGACAGLSEGSGKDSSCTWERKLCITCFKQ